MKSAKIITIIAFISNSYLLVSSLLIHLELRPTFKDLQMPMPFPWPSLFALIFLIGIVVYWFYLKRKEKKGEKVKFALWVSFALLLISILLIGQMAASTYIQPMYEILDEIR